MSAPRNAQHEPPYPDHQTVVFSIRDPNTTAHNATDRCAKEYPHPMNECGEFRVSLPGDEP